MKPLRLALICALITTPSLQATAQAVGPKLIAIWSGNITTDSATVVALLNIRDVSTRLALSTESTLANRTYFGPVVTDSATGNAVRFEATGLAASTTYYYAVEIGGTLLTESTRTGKFKTFPAEGPASFRFVFASCGDETDRPIYEAIRKNESDALFFLHMGDLNYDDDNTPDPEAYRDNYRKAVAAAHRQGALFRSIPVVYMWDDHDFSGDGSHKDSIGRDAHLRIYREMVPHYPVGAGRVPIYQAYTVGRVRFIITDLRSARDAAEELDDAHKSMMGADQKRWFKDQLIAARDAGAPLIIWNSSVSFISNETVAAGCDNWGVYQTERLELLTFIRENNIQNLMIVAGDTHALAYDSGAATESYLAGVPIPVFVAASLTRSGSSKGGPYDGGILPGPDHYGTIDIVDYGGPIKVTFSGKIATSTDTVTSWKTFTFTTKPGKAR